MQTPVNMHVCYTLPTFGYVLLLRELFKRWAAEKGSINLLSEFSNPFSMPLTGRDPLPVLGNYPNISCTPV